MTNRPATLRGALAATLAALSLAAGPAAAATRYVDAANTSGVEDGSQAAPYASIQRAIDAAVAGDVVSVAPGVYYENVTLKDLVDLASQRGAAATIVDGQGGYVVGSWFQGGAVRATVDGFTIRNGSTLVHGVSAFASGFTQITVRNSVIRDGGLGVRASIASQFTFENVVFYNTGDAISTIWAGAGPRLRNVTIDVAARAAWCYQTNLQLTNTSVTDVGQVVSTPSSCYVSGSHDNFFGYSLLTEGPVNFAVTDWLSADPLFVDPPGDYRLSPGSPLVDAGVDVGLPFQGAAPDIGAVESPGTPPQQVAALAASINEAPVGAFRSPAEQRRHAVYQQLMAVLHMFESIKVGTPVAEKKGVLAGAAAKLRNEVLAKGDGFFGGNPANDWIVSQAEQAEFYPRVLALLQTIEAELAAIP